MMLLMGLLGLAVAQDYGFDDAPRPSPAVMERRLAILVNDYRADQGLPPVPISPALTQVARAHVRDLMASRPNGAMTPGGRACNMHSWSNKGPWTPVCYTPDHARAQAMWSKPREITKGAYPFNGYEIAYWWSGGVTPEIALEGWEDSPAHDALLIESGPWRGADWRAMGVGILGNYAVVWFGKEPESPRKR